MNRLIKKNLKKDILKLTGFCILLALFIIGAGELVIQNDADHEKNRLRDRLQNSGALLAQDIQRNIGHAIFGTETLHALIKSSRYQVDNFEKWSRQIINSSLGPSVVQLAPRGIVNRIYPLEENQGDMGHDILKEMRQEDGTLKSVPGREMIFTGPVRLIKNGKYALIARKPVFREMEDRSDFWGFTLAILLVEDILPEKIQFMEAQGLMVRIEGDNPYAEKNPILFESKGWNGSYLVRMCIEVPNGKWILKLNHQPIENQYHPTFRLLIILTAFLAGGYIFIQQYRMRARQLEIIYLNAQLTKMSYEDDLTCAGNRRAGIQALKSQMCQAVRYRQPFAIAMIDLDHFKQVNDKYGHLAGDQMLCHLTTCLKKAVRRSDQVFRQGGDEFLMVFPQTDLEKGLKAIENIIGYIKNNPCRIDQAELPIHLSVGLAQNCPEESVDSLLNRADIKLYEAKEAGRNCIRY